MATSKKEPSLYVALGASAGGLEALETFFSNTPDDTGFAFVVIQHLSPDHKSLMVELLSKKTKMEVLRAEDQMEVEANKIYLIPPKKNLTVFHGTLLLHDQKPSRGINFPIDIFFRSLAEDQQDKGVGIIFSGTGSDGMQGVRAIKEHGGIVMVQSEETAKFDGMPRAAISTGLVDFILDPGSMVEKLVLVSRHIKENKAASTEELLSEDSGITKVFAILRDRHKIDFTYYKPNTVQRRIQRRMTVNQITDLKEYVYLLNEYPAEVTALYRELLIGVTSFFRNPEVFRILSEKVLPDLLSGTSNDELRCWVAGCSTGEEAYTLAILIHEALEAAGSRRSVKIFATDIDRDAITVAQNGVYPESIAADLDPKILSRYFYRKDDSFRVSRVIREMVVFAQHNIIKDPPFTNIDLVSCRNLLIYLQPVLQKKVLEMFAFSLQKGGILLLGTSETTGDLGDYFDHTYQKQRIFKIKENVRHSGVTISTPNTFSMARSTGSKSAAAAGTDMSFGRMGDEIKFMERFMMSLVDYYKGVAIVTNEHLDVLHVVGETDGLFKLPAGRMTSDISRLASKDLALPLTTGIQKVFRTKEEVKYKGVIIVNGGTKKKYDIIIRLLPENRRQESLSLVLLEDVTNKRIISSENGETDDYYSLSQSTEQHISDLEQELQFTKENLQATIEELETANEELQATNEELLASNEELQSTNEELQSTNEELHTINAQYQSKIIELTELNNDVENLLTSSQIGKIILDGNLEIRRYSPHVLKVFKLLEDDIGRPLSHISHYLKNVDPEDIATNVVNKETTIEMEVETRDGNWYLMRAIPYKIGPEVFSGAVMTFVDINQIKATQMALAESEANLRFTAEISQVANWRLDLPTEEIILSREGYDLLCDGVHRSLNLEKALKVFKDSDRRRLENILNRIGREKEFDVIVQGTLDGKPKSLRIIGSPLRENNTVVAVTGAVQDVTSMINREQANRETEVKYRHLYEFMHLGVVYQDIDGKIIDANPAAERILGLSRGELLGRESRDPRWKSLDATGKELAGENHPSMRALKAGKELHDEVMGIYNPKRDETVWIKVWAKPVFEKSDKNTPSKVYTIFDEIAQPIKQS